MKTLTALQNASQIAGLVIYITFAGGGGRLFGQASVPPVTPTATTAPAVIKPDPDHHTVYHLFFNQHTRQSQRIDGFRGTNPQQASGAEAALAAQYKISLTELAALNKVLATTSAKLDGIEAEAKGLFEAAGHSNAAPIQAKIDDLNARRYRAVIAGVSATRKALSPAS